MIFLDGLYLGRFYFSENYPNDPPTQFFFSIMSNNLELKLSNRFKNDWKESFDIRHILEDTIQTLNYRHSETKEDNSTKFLNLCLAKILTNNIINYALLIDCWTVRIVTNSVEEYPISTSNPFETMNDLSVLYAKNMDIMVNGMYVPSFSYVLQPKIMQRIKILAF